MVGIMYGIAGLFLGITVGAVAHRAVAKPCKFCGYSDDQTQELFEAEELDKLLRENE